MVDVEELDRVDRVLLCGSAVSARGFEAGVAQQFGDDDKVGAPADESCREGVAQDVSGDLVVLQAGGGGDRGDDVVRALDRQPAAALVEKQGGGVGAGPIGAFVEPVGEGGLQVGVDRDLADPAIVVRRRRVSAARSRRSSSAWSVTSSRSGHVGGVLDQAAIAACLIRSSSARSNSRQGRPSAVVRATWAGSLGSSSASAGLTILLWVFVKKTAIIRPWSVSS